MILARDGLRELLLSSLTLGLGGSLAAEAAITGSPLWWLAAGPLLALWLFTLAFFRDPHRTIPADPDRLVSPADGTVTEVTRLPDCEGFKGPALRIGIFLSLFNVHINRSPCAGRVIRTDYRPGEFLDARHPESGIRNEAMTIRIEPNAGVPGPIIVRQIAGLLARRIVCRVAAGDRVTRGGRFGLIKFGSRTELILPDRPEVRAVVRVGDRVRGGSSVLVRVEMNRSHQADDNINTAATDHDISTTAAN